MMNNTSLFVRFGFGLVVGLVGAGVAVAQEPAELDFGSLSLEELMNIPIVTASRHEQTAAQAPASVTVIRREEIQQYGYRTLADVLRGTLSFSTTYDRNYEYLGVRGFAIAGDYNNRILLLINGHRQNDAVYDSASLGTEFPVDIDLVERIEIVRGPSSSLYGNSAFFAVINVITRGGASFEGLEVSASAASQDTYSGRFSYGKVYSNDVELVISATTYDSEGDDIYFPEFDDPETNRGVAEGQDGDRFEQLFARLSKGDWAMQLYYGDRVKDVPTASYETAFNVRQQVVDRYFSGNVVYQHAFEDTSSVEARVYYDYYEYTGEYPYDWPPIVIGDDSLYAERIGADANYTKTVTERHTVTVGGEIRDNFRQDQAYADRDPVYVYLDDTRDSDSWALYAQDEIRISPSLTAQLGGRYDEYESFGGTANPRLALVYAPTDRSTLKLLYGEAFRAPNAYESYYGDGGESQKGNEDLEPETIETLEAVLEQVLTDELLLSLSGYHYDIEDLITLIEDPEDELMVFQNSEPVNGVGAEVALDARLERGINARASYSYQKAELDRTDEWLPNSPQHLAKANLSVPLLGEKLILGTEVQYGSERKTLADDRTDDSVRVNLTLFSRPVRQDLELSASVYNVFDEEAEHPGGSEHLQDVLVQDGRLFRVKMTYRF